MRTIGDVCNGIAEQITTLSSSMDHCPSSSVVDIPVASQSSSQQPRINANSYNSSDRDGERRDLVNDNLRNQTICTSQSDLEVWSNVFTGVSEMVNEYIRQGSRGEEVGDVRQSSRRRSSVTNCMSYSDTSKEYRSDNVVYESINTDNETRNVTCYNSNNNKTASLCGNPESDHINVINSSNRSDIHSVIDDQRRQHDSQSDIPVGYSLLNGFNIDLELNQKIVLYEGNDISRFDADCAIVLFTNEYCTVAESNPGNDLIISASEGSDSNNSNGSSSCGHKIISTKKYKLPDSFRRLDEPINCGEAKLVKVYSDNAPSRHYILTVGPRYVEKYHTASETSLHSCYREALMCLVEAGLQTIIIPCFYYREIEGYPKDVALHIILRTLRKCVEYFREEINCIVFFSSDREDIFAFSEALPLYFPRSAKEEATSQRQLDTCIANKFGDAYIQERRIRVCRSSSDTFQQIDDNEEDKSFGLPNTRQDSSSDSSDNVDEKQKIHRMVDLSFAFAQFEQTESERRELANRTEFSSIMASDDEGHLFYAKLYCEARTFSRTDQYREVAKYSFFYSPGNDNDGRTVVVFLGAMFPAYIDWYHVLLYIVWKMDEFMQDRFTFLLVNTAVDNKSNAPSLRFMREIHRLLVKRYLTKVDRIIILQASFGFKFLFNLCWQFLPTQYTSHVALEFIDSEEELLRFMPLTSIRLPKFVKEYNTNNS